ncbi:unnamed protein product [Lupinus luteus]|uniref:Uncharacterized protein n=1 Tax=Lupinus luteus TaxID=3873 RepID=A0AAV1WW72_LUPLU
MSESAIHIFGLKEGTDLDYRQVFHDLSFFLAALSLVTVLVNLDMEIDPARDQRLRNTDKAHTAQAEYSKHWAIGFRTNIRFLRRNVLHILGSCHRLGASTKTFRKLMAER